MILRAIILCAAFLLTSEAHADLSLSTDSYQPFNDARYVEDHQSNIVMTVQRETWRNGFGVDFRGLRDEDGIYRVEYFCEPDAVLLVGEPGRNARAYYLGYLAWTDDLYVSGPRAIFQARHAPSMGTVSALLPAPVQITPPNLDISVSHILEEGAGFVQSIVEITNTRRTPQRLTYVYQDSAFMWFPDGDQRNVESVRIVATADGPQSTFNAVSSGRTPAGHWQFIGTFNRERGVVAGIVTTDTRDIAGIHYEYVGVEDQDDGTFVPRRRVVIPEGQGGGIATATFVNRFIALDFGEVQPGEQQRRFYNSIMTVLPPESRTDDGIYAWVVSMVRTIQGAGVQFAD